MTNQGFSMPQRGAKTSAPDEEEEEAQEEKLADDALVDTEAERRDTNSDYTLDELVQIGQLILTDQRYEMSPEADAAFRDYLERRMRQPRFANGRSVRNALERARLRHATRIVSERRPLGKADLMRLEAEDILKSRVFEEEDNPEGD